MRKTSVAIAVVAVIAFGAWAVSAAAARHARTHEAAPVAGSLSEKIAASSCYSDNHAGQGEIDCQQLAHIHAPDQMLFSPDGRFVYLADSTPDGNFILTVLRRNAATGALAFLACYGPATGCSPTRVQFTPSGPQSIVLSTGGAYLYAEGSRPEAGDGGGGAPEIASFARDAATGLLTELPDPTGCMVTTVGAGGDDDPATAPCNHSVTPMDATVAMVVVGGFLYAQQQVGSDEGAMVLTFATNADGSLTQLPPPGGCLDGSPTPANDTLPGQPPCAVWPLTADSQQSGLEWGIAAAPDGMSLYLWTDLASTQPAVFAVARDPGSGILTPGGCAGESAPCGSASLLGMVNNDQALAVSPDSRFVYVQGADPSERTGQIVTLARTAGGLHESSCVGSAFREVSPTRLQVGRLSGCTPAPPTLIGVGGLAMGPGGNVLYAATDQGPFTVSPIDALARNAATGALTPLPGVSFCIGADAVDWPEVNPLLNGCQQGLALGSYPVLSPDGRDLYTIGGQITVLHPRE